MDTRGADTMMYHASRTHPKYRPRYSDQTWVNQRQLRDPILDRILERYAKQSHLRVNIYYNGCTQDQLLAPSDVRIFFFFFLTTSTCST